MSYELSKSRSAIAAIRVTRQASHPGVSRRLVISPKPHSPTRSSAVGWLWLAGIFLLAGFCQLNLTPRTFAQNESAVQTSEDDPGVNLRPPAVPLVACDPYFSIWSEADRLNQKETTHWTGKPHRLQSQVTIDEVTYRLIGESGDKPAKQTSLQVLPTRTVYHFETPEVELTLTFCTPALPYDMDVLSWPITYLTYQVSARDGKPHNVSFQFQASGNLAVNEPGQPFTWTRPEWEGLTTVSVGSDAQPILATTGDDIRIDWGHLYLSTPAADGTTVGANHDLNWDLGMVSDQPQSRWLMLAYDDLYSIQYMRTNLRPYWRRDGRDAQSLITEAAERYAELTSEAAAFDQELMSDLESVGGREYALLCALCYRQCFAAGKFVADANGQPLQFSKENHSNGCIATSDVFYPMSPQFLLFGPTLAKSFVVPFMNYAASPRWKFPFAPHDLGTYPHANGQVYGGGETSEENQMPVEESGNMLILMAAIAKMEGNADFASGYWPQLTQWAEYLKDKGFDPENQLCTDDFAGHLAHNVNLSAKAIMGLGSYSLLCDMRGESEQAKEFRNLAQQFADRWVQEARDDDHYRLAFDRPGTWSQKYNLVWDRILDLNLFPREVARTEMDFYLKVQNEYGLPLDNRSDYTKLDWITWTATLTQDKDDFQALISPIIHFVNETPDRSPLTDWYFTSTARKRGFTARPVVGGVFLQMLYSQQLWSKWAKRDRTQASNWAAMPKMPKIVPVIPTAQQEAADWFYTTETPQEGWNTADFDPDGWKTGKAGFGTRETPSAIIGTRWDQSDIWLVRDWELPQDLDLEQLHWSLHHDEIARIYVNGKQVLEVPGWSTNYQLIPLSELAAQTLKPGRNRIAIHCHQTSGGQYIDLGLVRLKPAE